MNININKNYLILFYPISISIIIFWIILDVSILNTKNINWLLSDFDMTLEYLGWTFYRFGPWTFPIGLNPNFGIDISSSIIYSNSLPIFSLVFKPFSSFLSEPFQFWGIWILLCFILQAVFAWLIIGLLTNNIIIKIISIVFFLFSPPLISQIGFHNSTVGHYPILAAYYLTIRKSYSKQTLLWSILLSTSLLVHPYTFAMVGFLWIANLANHKLIMRRLSWKNFIKETSIVFLTIGIVAWQAGYFMNVSPGESGYGLYRANLLGFFDPSGFDSHNWSYIFSLPWVKQNNNYEGFIYLGLGLIILLFFAILKIANLRQNLLCQLKNYFFTFAITILMGAFALSNNIGIGTWNITIPISSEIFSLFSILRASGRFFWPIYYLLGITIFYLLIRGYSKISLYFLLSTALVIQVCDTSGAWKEIKNKINNPITQLGEPLRDPFWLHAANKYKKIVRVPVWNEQVIWEKFASYAANHRLATNSVFMGRVDKARISESNSLMTERIQNSHFDADTLYIVEDDKVEIFIKYMNHQSDLLARFDEINVFAPGWLDCKICPAVDKNDRIDTFRSSHRLTKLGEQINFSRFGKYVKAYLDNGWSIPENWGTWSMSERATLTIPLPATNPKKLIIFTQAFIVENHPHQNVNLIIHGKNSKQNLNFVLNKRFKNQVEINLLPSLLEGDNLKLEFEFPLAISPKALGIGNDTRLLAIGLEKIIYE